jgi:hypothetical protein
MFNGEAAVSILLGLVIGDHPPGRPRPPYLAQDALKAALNALVAAEHALTRRSSAGMKTRPKWLVCGPMSEQPHLGKEQVGHGEASGLR